VSTGTWSVSLNPFTTSTVVTEDPSRQCINYMRIDGKPVKAARLFLGQEYKEQTAALARHFGVGKEYHKTVSFNYDTYRKIVDDFEPRFHFGALTGIVSATETRIPDHSYAYPYHQLMVELVRLQAESICTAMGETVPRKLFIDGGFSDNAVYVKLLSHHFLELSVRTTDSSLGSALGAAIVISDKTLNSKFLKQNYGLRKHQPFIIIETIT